MIDHQELSRAFESGFSPLPGKCLIELDTIPTMAGLLHIPDSSRELRTVTGLKGQTVYGDSSWTGRVKAVSSRKSDTGKILPEAFTIGDRVLILLLQEDLNQKMIVTSNTRVYAVIDDGHESTGTNS